MVSQAHVYIIGDVIGVGFRAWTKIQAKQLGITGWVKNTHSKPEIFGHEGGVEALFQGPTHQVNEMIERVKSGPAVSRVDDLEVYWQEPKQMFSAFEIVK